jgi:hypothetical protein
MSVVGTFPPSRLLLGYDARFGVVIFLGEIHRAGHVEDVAEGSVRECAIGRIELGYVFLRFIIIYGQSPRFFWLAFLAANRRAT